MKLNCAGTAHYIGADCPPCDSGIPQSQGEQPGIDLDEVDKLSRLPGIRPRHCSSSGFGAEQDVPRHYLDLPFDLSKTLFRDDCEYAGTQFRGLVSGSMEVIRLTVIQRRKVQIARRI